MPTESIPTDRREASLRAVVAAFLLLGLAYPASRVVLAFGLAPARFELLFKDDAYYYAVIAENIASGRGSTFGGLVPTNGYQPLWQWLLVPLAALFDGDALLRAIYVLTAVLFATTIVLAWALTRRLGATTAGAVGCAYMVAVGLLAGKLFFGGMEIAVVLPAVLAFTLAVVTPTTTAGWRRGALLGLLGLTVVLARLDALAYVLALGVAHLAPRATRRARSRPALTATVAVAAGLVAYAGFNLLNFGSPVPVSGQAKALGATGVNVGILKQYLTFGSVGPLPLLLGAQALLVTALALAELHRRRVFDRVESDRAATMTLWALLAAQFAQLSYYAATSSWSLWEWYFYYIPVQLLVGGTVLTHAAITVVGRWLRQAAPVAAALVAVAFGAVALTSASGVAWQAAVPATARWITAHTGPADVVAVGDRAGYLTWLTGRPTVQLEGLVEDPAHLGALNAHDLDQLMSVRRARYYVRSDDQRRLPEPAPDARGCRVFLEPAQGDGPKSPIRACHRDEVYRIATGDYTWTIYQR